jgi:hypothetical protein
MDFDNENHNFTIRFDSNDGNRSLEMNFNELFLDDILNQVRDFLRGCGYEIDGQIQVVPSEHEDVYVGTDDYLVSDDAPDFSFENIPNNNWPFSSTVDDSIESVDSLNLELPEEDKTTSYAMPGTVGSAKVTFK